MWCLSDTLCQRARNNFSNILSSSKNAAEFSERLQALVYHVQDIHEWEGRQCQFHALTVCSCGSCTDKNKPQCQGKDYRTREVLSCPFHMLVYKIECHIRAKMADQLVDSTLTLKLAGEFSGHLHSVQAETYFPRAALLSRGHKPWAVAGQPDSEIQSRGSGLSLED